MLLFQKVNSYLEFLGLNLPDVNLGPIRTQEAVTGWASCSNFDFIEPDVYQRKGNSEFLSTEFMLDCWNQCTSMLDLVLQQESLV